MFGNKWVKGDVDQVLKRKMQMTFNEMFYSLSVLCVLNMGEHPNKNQNKTKKQLNI